MGKPAARLTDMHTCPMVTGLVPHVGGPVSGPCVPTVLIGMMPAATVGDMCVCVGPPDAIAMGSPTVLIGGKMAARMGDPTVHGGVIVIGCPTVLIGEAGSGGAGGSGGGGGGEASGPTEESLLSNLLNAASGLAGQMLDSMKTAFQEVKNYLAEKYAQARANAQNADNAANSKGPSMKGTGSIGAKSDMPGGDAKGKAKLEVDGTVWSGQKTFLQVGDKDNNLIVGKAAANADVGYSYDPKKQERFAGAKAKAEAAAIQGKASGEAAHGLVGGEIEGKALAAKADAKLGAEWDEQGHRRLVGEAGAEAVLVSGSAKGQIKVTPKTIWDNACNAVAEGSSYCNAPAYLDHGVVAGIQGEAGIGAAAKAEAAVGSLEEGGWGIKAGAKAGAGPMAGVKAFLGFI